MWGDFFEKTFWIWIIIFVFCLIFGIQKCSDSNSDIQDKSGDGYNVVIVDSCEYIRHHEGYSGYMAHKGNCKFCAIRQKKMIESIIKSNK